jgi:hypothetical protein
MQLLQESANVFCANNPQQHKVNIKKTKLISLRPMILPNII